MGGFWVFVPLRKTKKFLKPLKKIIAYNQAQFLKLVITCPVLFQIGSINSCPLIYVDDTEEREVLVLEHMKQHGWKDATHKKKGSFLLGIHKWRHPRKYLSLYDTRSLGQNKQ